MGQQRRRQTLWLKIMMVAGRHFIRKKLFVRDVPALTFATLMAMVPVLALIFAIAKMMGSDFSIDHLIDSIFEAQPQVADTVTTFVYNYLEHTKSGYIVSTGVIMMIYTVFTLMQKIETSFNRIWHIRRGRTLWRMITDYTAIFAFIVVMIFISSSMFIVLRVMADTLDTMLQTGSLARRSLTFVPYVSLILLFYVLFKSIPSTYVKWRSAIVPSIVSGVLMAVLQFYYFKLQIGLASYNVIYGSFAALPLYLLWMELSWAICLYGVELCYAIQNLSHFDYNLDVYDLSNEQHTIACAVVMREVCRGFDNGGQCYTPVEIQNRTMLPQQVVDYSLERLVDIDMLREYKDRHHAVRFTPSMDTNQLNVGLLLTRLEHRASWEDSQSVIHLDSDQWGRVSLFRQECLDKCSTILLKDL